MDLNTLSVLVMEKLKDANLYSELDDKALFKSIYGYLDLAYKRNFYLAKKRIESDELRGIFPNPEKYKKEYDAVEDIVMAQANKLAAITRDQI